MVPVPSKAIGTGECTIGIGMLHDGIYIQVLTKSMKTLVFFQVLVLHTKLILQPVFKGAAHPNAARLWIDALSPSIDLAQKNGSYQFLVIDNAKAARIATEYGLDQAQCHGLQPEGC